MTTSRRLVLASASPRRRAILAMLGVPLDVCPTAVPEEPVPGESPRRTAERLAHAKAEAAAHLARDAVIVAADTVVAVDGQQLGKPASPAEAREWLRRLRGRVHEVSTGVVVLDAATGRRAADVVTTRVRMRDYDDAEIDAYVATGDPLDKAGAYAIQHTGFHPVAWIAGCYLNVVGLPLCATARLLVEIGVEAPGEAPRGHWKELADDARRPPGACGCAMRWANEREVLASPSYRRSIADGEGE